MASTNQDSSNNRKEPNSEDNKSNKLSMRLKKFLPATRSNSTDSRKSTISSEAPEEGDHSSNDECWVDLPNNNNNRNNQTTDGSTGNGNSRTSESGNGSDDSPPEYSQTNFTEEQGELKLEDLKWLPTPEDSFSSNTKPRTPPAVSMADDRYPLDSEPAEQQPLLSQDNDTNSNSNRTQPSSSAPKNPPTGINALLELQMDPVQKKRNIDFHINFPSLPLDDILIEDWHCALQKDILVTGRLYVTQERICFHSNLFGWVNHTMIPFSDIVSLQKRSTAFVIPNAIQIITLDQKYFFTSFMSRDSAHTLLYELWYKKCPNRATDPAKLLPNTTDSKSDTPCNENSAESGINTMCSCLKTSSHEGVVNIDTVYPTSMETLFGLLFGEDTTFIKDHLSESNTEVAIGAWQGDDTRTITYIKPLNMPIGPKQTRCNITERILNRDFEDYCSVEVRTQNPDVPSGDAFTVVSRNCLSVSRTNQVRLITTTFVEWSKGSWFKGPIENGAKEGTTKSAQDLDGALRSYLKSHPDLVTKPVGDDQPETICEVQSYSEKELQDGATAPLRRFPSFGFTPNFRNVMVVVLVILFGIFMTNRWRISQLQSQIAAIPSSPPTDSTEPRVDANQFAHLRELQTNLRELGGQLEAIEHRLKKFRRDHPVA